MIVQAHFFRHDAAFAQRVHPVQELLGLLCRISIGVGAKIFGFIFKHPSGHFQTGMLFIRYFKIWIGFIILQRR